MSAKFSPKVREFVASCLIDSITLQQIQPWITLTNYLEGDVVYYKNNKYICKGTGQSGAIPPVHVNGTASDGAVNWIWVEALNVNEAFKRNVFVFIGKPSVWTDENAPDEVGISDRADHTTIKNIMTLKRVTTNNFSLAIKRVNWTNGAVYSGYDDLLDPLAPIGDQSYPHPYYVYTDESNIYKCIDNNNGAVSTVKPTDTGLNVFELADGYVWKYMGSLEIANINFLTKDYVPVRYKLLDDSSAQWAVQGAAKKNSISAFKIIGSKGVFNDTALVTIVGGSPTTPAEAYISKNVDNTIKQIIVNNPGLGYDASQTIEAIVKKAGKAGSGATITSITRNGSGVITNITLGQAGTGYTDGAIVVLVDEGSTPSIVANITVTISPSNTVSQLNIVNGGSGYSANVRAYIIPGDAGAVGKVVLAPKEGHGYNIVTELCANTAIVSVRLTEESDYLQVGTDYAFRQVGLITDVQEYGTTDPAYNSIYIGPSHPNYNANTLNRIDANRGYVLYVNNIKKVVRSDGQEEDLKVAVTF